MVTRRRLLKTAGAALAASGVGVPLSAANGGGVPLSPGLPAGLEGAALMEALPGKHP
jgi:hypothetical protein